MAQILLTDPPLLQVGEVSRRVHVEANALAGEQGSDRGRHDEGLEPSELAKSRGGPDHVCLEDTARLDSETEPSPADLT